MLLIYLPRIVWVLPFPGYGPPTSAGRLMTLLVACEMLPERCKLRGDDMCGIVNSIRCPSSNSQPLLSTVPPFTTLCAPSPAVANGTVVVRIFDVRLR